MIRRCAWAPCQQVIPETARLDAKYCRPRCQREAVKARQRQRYRTDQGYREQKRKYAAWYFRAVFRPMWNAMKSRWTSPPKSS